MFAGTHWVHEILSMLLTSSTEYNKFCIVDCQLELPASLEKFDKLSARPFIYVTSAVQISPGTVTERKR